MWMRALVLVAASSLVVAAAAPQKGAPPKGKTRQVFVSVTDQAGAPVTDLSAGDFDIQEKGVKRPVVKATLGGAPMRIVLMIDTGSAMSAALNHLRAGLAAFLDEVPQDAEVALVSMGGQVRVRVPPTVDRKKLNAAATSIFMDSGATVLIDGVLEMDDRFFKKAEDRWPVFVILTSDGAEGSAGAHEKEFNQWAHDVAQRDITVHALVYKVKGNGLPDIVAQTLAQNSGGQYDGMNTTNALPDKMKTLALLLKADQNQMKTKYQVEFTTDQAAASPGLDIGVSRPGVKLKMSFQRK